MMVLGALLFAAAAHTVARPPDACQVLSKSDIAAVQGESYTNAKLTTYADVSQCFYQLPSFTKSVSVDVIRDGREFWEQHFREPEESGEEESRPPREIEGIGDEALWMGGRMAGALYVRKGDFVLRISVGGPGDEASKIAKSKTLAARALIALKGEGDSDARKENDRASSKGQAGGEGAIDAGGRVRP